MKKNIGSFDGGARFVIGCSLLLTGLLGLGWWGLLGLVPLLTCFAHCIGSCDWTPRHGKRVGKRAIRILRSIQTCSTKAQTVGPHPQNSACPGVRANGITSRMLLMPVTNISMRSKPRPNPECGTLP